MAKSVVGLFDTQTEAQSVLQDLVDHGFTRESISLVANNADKSYGDHDTTGTTTGATAASTGTGSAAVHGAETGAVVGGIAGLLVGLTPLLIPGIGPIVAAGTLATILTGAGIGAVAGGLIGALTHIGVPHEEAEYYNEGVRRGGTLVLVNTPDNLVDTAVDIFHKHGAVDIEQRGEQYRETGFTGYDAAAPALPVEDIHAHRAQYTAPAATTTTVATGETATIPVVQEELAVGTRTVEKGRARIYTHVTETPVQEQVTLREEHVTIDRQPVNRPVTDADMGAFKEGSIEVREMGEEAVVAKQARVVEEVTGGKVATERTETITDTVRRTDVDVDEDLHADKTTTGSRTGGSTL